MSAERDIEKSLKRIVDIEKELSARAPTLAEQASILEEDIGRRMASGEPRDIEMLARLCLLSEMCGALDFDRMISARERFQEAFPQQFSYYLSNLESIGWRITWPGCLECVNFDGACGLGVTPIDTPDSRTRFDKFCPMKAPRVTVQ